MPSAFGAAYLQPAMPFTSRPSTLEIPITSTSRTDTSPYAYLKSTDVLKIRSSSSTTVACSSPTTFSNTQPVDLITVQ